MIGKREREGEREREKLKKKKKRVAVHYSKLLNFLKLSSSNIACILVFVVLKIVFFFFCGYFNTFNMNAKTTTKKPKSYLYYYESVNQFR